MEGESPALTLFTRFANCMLNMQATSDYERLNMSPLLDCLFVFDFDFCCFFFVSLFSYNNFDIFIFQIVNIKESNLVSLFPLIAIPVIIACAFFLFTNRKKRNYIAYLHRKKFFFVCNNVITFVNTFKDCVFFVFCFSWYLALSTRRLVFLDNFNCQIYVIVK